MCGSLAGGAGVEAARPDWLLVTAGSSSVGAAPVELCRGSAVFGLAAPRSGRVWSSTTGVRGVASSGVDVVEEADVESHGVRLDAARWRLQGVRGPMTSRPRGDTSDPRLRRGAAAARRRNITFASRKTGSRKDLCVISLFVLDLSVRTVA